MYLITILIFYQYIVFQLFMEVYFLLENENIIFVENISNYLTHFHILY